MNPGVLAKPKYQLLNLFGYNYLKVSGLPIGLLVNFRSRKLEWKRLQSNEEWLAKEETVKESSMI